LTRAIFSQRLPGIRHRDTRHGEAIQHDSPNALVASPAFLRACHAHSGLRRCRATVSPSHRRNLVVRALLGARIGQAPRPRERNADRSPVDEMSNNELVGDFDRGEPRVRAAIIRLRRSAHAGRCNEFDRTIAHERNPLAIGRPSRESTVRGSRQRTGIAPGPCLIAPQHHELPACLFDTILLVENDHASVGRPCRVQLLGRIIGNGAIVTTLPRP
jgi:hypothetical protein